MHHGGLQQGVSAGKEMPERPEGINCSRTGLCRGVFIALQSCDWHCCAIPAANVLFRCAYSQVLSCTAKWLSVM